MSASSDALQEALGDALRPLRLTRGADAHAGDAHSPAAVHAAHHVQSPATAPGRRLASLSTPSPGPSSAPASTAPSSHGAPSAPSTVPRPPGGLRMLSLPTVGATQAAADAAAAAMQQQQQQQQPRRDAELSDSGTSYFRRFSMIRQNASPAPLTAPPPPVLKSVDAVRGILFALSQIYSALKQYIGVTSDERLAGSFQRMLSTAAHSLSTLISALDKFDAQRTPDPHVIRSVVESARESVLAFRRVVRALSASLDALEQSVDARFTRMLLVMLYGSIAEVCNSTTALSANLHAVAPIIASTPPSSASPSHVPLVTPVRSITLPSRLNKRRFARSQSGETSLYDGDDAPSSPMPAPSSASSTRSVPRTLLSPGVSPGDPSRLAPSRSAPPAWASASSRSPSACLPTAPPTLLSATPSTTSVPTTSSMSSHRDLRLSPGTRAENSSGDSIATDVLLPIDVHLLDLLNQAADRSVGVWSDVLVHAQGRVAALAAANAHDDPPLDGPQRQVRELIVMCSDVLDLARRMQDVLSAFAWNNPTHAQLLLDSADQFVRSTMHISTLIRDIPAAAALPNPLMRRVGEAAFSCAALATHLHRLNHYAAK